MPPSSAGAVPQAHTDPYAPCPPTEAAPAKDGFVRLISETSPGRRRRDRHSLITGQGGLIAGGSCWRHCVAGHRHGLAGVVADRHGP
jgi:hypothetical protein